MGVRSWPTLRMMGILGTCTAFLSPLAFMHMRLELMHPRQVLKSHAAVSSLRCVQEKGKLMGC